jgi:hypothetical protein
MQNNEQTHLHENLKDEVERKFGTKLKFTGNCKLLSSQIFEATNRQLSVSTVKRFFGIIPSPFNPSKYTLDTLSTFIGFDGWDSFVNAKNFDEQHPKSKIAGRY